MLVNDGVFQRESQNYSTGVCLFAALIQNTVQLFSYFHIFQWDFTSKKYVWDIRPYGILPKVEW